MTGSMLAEESGRRGINNRIVPKRVRRRQRIVTEKESPSSNGRQRRGAGSLDGRDAGQCEGNEEEEVLWTGSQPMFGRSMLCERSCQPKIVCVDDPTGRAVLGDGCVNWA